MPAPTPPSTVSLPTQQTNDIRNFRVISVSNNVLRFTVDYTYSGDHRDNIWLGAYALKGDQQLIWFAYSPDRATRGSGSATIELEFGFNNSPSSVTTDQIRVDMYVGGGSGFYTRTFNYTKMWSTP
jgi:hypothetical protein